MGAAGMQAQAFAALPHPQRDFARCQHVALQAGAGHRFHLHVHPGGGHPERRLAPPANRRGRGGRRRNQICAAAKAPQLHPPQPDTHPRIATRVPQLMQRLVEPPGVGHGLVVPLNEIAQQVARARAGQTGQQRAIEPFAGNGCLRIEPRQIVQQVGRIGLQRGRAREGGAAAGKIRSQERHHLPTQRIAAVTDVPIAFVVDPGQAVRLRIIQQPGTRHAQQRPELRCAPAGPGLQFGHRRQAFRSSAAQQLQ